MNKKDIPNILSMFRIILVPFYLVALYFIGGHQGIGLAILIFTIASITDCVDGYLARKFDCVSDFGKVIDPLADKLLVSAALLSLVFEPVGVISIYPALIIIFREVLISVIRKVYSNREIYISANFWGKIKTTAQMGGIVITLLFSLLTIISDDVKNVEETVTLIIQLFFWVVVVITIVSGLSYLPALRKK